jgi:RNA-binding protein 8A
MSNSTSNQSSARFARKHDDDEDDEISQCTYGPIRSVEGWVVFVTNLHDETREDDLSDAFAEYGTVQMVKMNYDRRTGYGKGYALVEFQRRNEAQDCINRMHGSKFMGRTIQVHWAFVQPTEQSDS